MNFYSCNPKTRNEQALRAFITGFLLFQFRKDFIGTHALGKQLLQYGVQVGQN